MLGLRCNTVLSVALVMTVPEILLNADYVSSTRSCEADR
jgi:hypothetical protein